MSSRRLPGETDKRKRFPDIWTRSNRLDSTDMNIVKGEAEVRARLFNFFFKHGNNLFYKSLQIERELCVLRPVFFSISRGIRKTRMFHSSKEFDGICVSYRTFVEDGSEAMFLIE